MTPAQQQMQILRKYATGESILGIAADCGVGTEAVGEVVAEVNFQRGRAAELVRQHDAAMFNRHVVGGRLTAPHPEAPRRKERETQEKPAIRFFRWEDPSPSRSTRVDDRRRHSLSAIAEQIRAEPNRWAVIYESTIRRSGIGAQIRAGLLGFEPAGAFDACERVLNGVRRIYAIYLGEDGSA